MVLGKSDGIRISFQENIRIEYSFGAEFIFIAAIGLEYLTHSLGEKTLPKNGQVLWLEDALCKMTRKWVGERGRASRRLRSIFEKYARSCKNIKV